MPLSLTQAFQQQGLLGEQTYDSSVWITKTHYPQDSHSGQRFSADKIIYITRHPIDVFPS